MKTYPLYLNGEFVPANRRGTWSTPPAAKRSPGFPPSTAPGWRRPWPMRTPRSPAGGAYGQGARRISPANRRRAGAAAGRNRPPDQQRERQTAGPEPGRDRHVRGPSAMVCRGRPARLWSGHSAAGRRQAQPGHQVADRRGGRHQPVEFPAGAGGAQSGARAGRRLPGGAQAGAADAAELHCFRRVRPRGAVAQRSPASGVRAVR